VNWKFIVNFIGLPAAAWGTIIALVAALDFLGIRPVVIRELRATDARVAANTSAVQLIRWQLLEERRRTQGLGPGERVEHCTLSQILGLQGEGCA
jgi:hypothetical protein